MGMMLAKTNEDPTKLLEFVTNQVSPAVPENLGDNDAYYFLVPEQFTDMREMIETKFNELFGPRVMARVFTVEQTKHAKTVIPLDTELFISFGERNEVFGKPENRLTIPLPEQASYATFMAISYYFVGQIQKQFPPYYKERIGEYVQETSEMFGSKINVIVE